jgi:hypothetical protein
VKAISLWQPWASLWLTDRKIHETRSWPMHLYGPLLVHAAKARKAMRPDEHHSFLVEILEDEFGGHWAKDLPMGAIVGVVEIIDCKPTEEVYTDKDGAPSDDYWCGNFAPDRFAWKKGRYQKFERPIPYTGRQGFFEVPLDVINPQLPIWCTP